MCDIFEAGVDDLRYIFLYLIIGTQVQWAIKGSYRTEHVLKFVENLPDRGTILCPGRRQILTLDDYSAHLEPSVRKALFRKGYFLIVPGGGITGDVQINDTHYHHPAKDNYREIVKYSLDINQIYIHSP